jgi:superfamily I DNA/RNA helicase
MTTHTPTAEMNTILKAVTADTNNSIIVEAKAGAGKTSTISLIIPRLPTKKILYLTYNKHIAVEAQAKLACYSNVKVQTVHSLAYNACGYLYQHKLGELAYSKLKAILEGYSLTVTWSEVKAIKSTLDNYFASDVETIGEEHVENKQHVDVKKLLDAAKWLWQEMCSTESDILMPHDGYFKLFCNSYWQQALAPFDTLIVDESQDQTKPFVSVERSFWLSGRQLIKVGDECQALFRYRGAVNANEEFATEINCLDLSTCFRFGPQIAEACEKLLKLKGKAYTVKGNKELTTKIHPVGTRLSGDRTLLHRKAISVVFSAMALSKKPLNIKVVGGLDNYITSELAHYEKVYFGQVNRVPKWFAKQFPNWGSVKRYVEDTKDPDVKRVVALLESMGSRGIKSLSDFIADINQRPTNPQLDTVELTTVHRYKGAEADKVVLSSDFSSLQAINKLPKTELWDEIHILYVALTRCRTDIVLNEVLQDILWGRSAPSSKPQPYKTNPKSRYL